jgi:acetyl esterase/lipase
VPSLRSHLVVFYLKATGRKKPYLDPALLEARIAADPGDHRPPAALQKKYHITGTVVEGFPCYTMGQGPLRILYLHGGSYVFEIVKEHWRFLARIADHIPCTITVPIYPLARRHDHRDVERMLAALRHPFDVIMGDSAGGGMALTLAQSGIAQPKEIVLISPWLDVELENPNIDDHADPWLARPGLRHAGRKYAGPDSPRAVSPVHGPLEGVAPITIFMGTRDILLADARLLRDRGNVRLIEGEGMVHVWPLLPIPEARRAIAQMVEILRRV